jgi:hypothetical protein
VDPAGGEDDAGAVAVRLQLQVAAHDARRAAQARHARRVGGARPGGRLPVQRHAVRPQEGGVHGRVRTPGCQIGDTDCHLLAVIWLSSTGVQVFWLQNYVSEKFQPYSVRPEFEAAGGVRDVDEVITTRDLGALLRRAGIDPGDLEPSEFDSPLGGAVQL